MTLWQIKLLHTVLWAVFALAIVAIPPLTYLGARGPALWLSLLVWAEVLVLLVNGLRCPLTAIAARHTPQRQDNFDIFLPLWLARNNKRIFGCLFAAAELYFAWPWASRWT